MFHHMKLLVIHFTIKIEAAQHNAAHATTSKNATKEIIGPNSIEN